MSIPGLELPFPKSVKNESVCAICAAGYVASCAVQNYNAAKVMGNLSIFDFGLPTT